MIYLASDFPTPFSVLFSFRTLGLACLALALPAQAQPVPSDSAATSPNAQALRIFDTLPVRTVRGVAAGSPGVRRDLATGALVVRSRPGASGGSIGQEPRFVVDGVRHLGDAGLPFETVRAVRVLTEGVPARLGQAAGGLVLVDTDADLDPFGRAFGGRLEALSSRATDAFGTDLGAVALRGPVASLGAFELAAEFGRQADATPFGVPLVRLTYEAYALAQQTPQSVLVTEGGVQRAVPFPIDAALAAGGAFTADDLRRELGLAPSAEIAPGLVWTVETLGADAFERRPAKDDPLTDLRLAGGLTLRPADGLAIRTTGRLRRQHADRTGSPVDVFANALLNQDGLYTTEQSGFGLATAAEHTLSPTLRYRLYASTERQTSVSYPFGFSDALEDVLLYGDIDDPRSAAARRYVVNYSDGRYAPLYTNDGGPRPFRIIRQTYSLPGHQSNRDYAKGEEASTQVGGAIHLDVGAHRVELGAELEQETHRRFEISGFGLAGFVDDGSLEQVGPEGFPNGVARYEQIPYLLLRNRVSYYGYTFNGLTTAGSEDVDAFFDSSRPNSDKDLAPFRPRTVAGFAEVASALGALSTRIGVRVEGYDANANLLFDSYAAVPIFRAGGLASVPDGIGDDFAVYYANDARQTVLGFRDLEGRFYDTDGVPTTSTRVLVDLQGWAVRDENRPRSDAYRDAPVRWSVEPRLHAALQATETVRLVASVERLSRRPDPSLYVPLQMFGNLASLPFTLGSLTLQPERTDAARLELSMGVAPSVSVGLSGFARRTHDLPALRVLEGAFPRYGATLHVGELEVAGLEASIEWRPSSALWVAGAYTLASAKHTEPGPNAFYSAFRPIEQGLLFPAPDDTRHAVDLVASGRFPAAGFGLLGGFGGGLVLSAQSGLPYTRLEPNTGFSVADAFTAPPRGAIYSARLPWTHQLDLRLDRQIAVGPATVEVFAWAENVLGTENVLALYRSTAMPNDDGYVGTSGGAALSPEQQALYRAYTSGAVNVGGNQSTAGAFFYGRPRQIRLGVRAAF